MLYIVSGELVPEANSLYHGRMTAVRKYDRIFNRNFRNNNLKIKGNVSIYPQKHLRKNV